MVRGLAIVLVVFVVSLDPAAADKKKAEVEPPPPMAQPIKVQVYRGETARIPLVALGRESRNSRFLIRSRPRFGTISEVQTLEGGRAFVFYRHGGGPAPARDEFTYAAQGPGTPVSAPAKVEILVVNRPAHLRYGRDIDFGEVLLGRGETRWIEIENLGGTRLETALSVDEGWELPEGASLALEPGQTVSWPVRFVPGEERAYEGVLRFSHSDKDLVRLKGSGLEPLAVWPREIVVHQTGSPPVVKLQNKTKDAIVVKVTSPPGLDLPAELEIPAGGSANFLAKPAPGIREGSEGEVALDFGFGKEKIPFRVFPLPAKLAVEPEGGIDFGSLVVGEQAAAKVVLRNEGGFPLSPEFLPSRWVNSGERKKLRLAPGEEAEVPLQFRPMGSGPYAGSIEIRDGNISVKYPVRASVAADPTGRAPDASAPASANQPQQAQRHQPPPRTPASAQKNGGEVFDIEGLEIVSRTPTSIILEWEQTVPGGGDIRLEQRRLDLDEAGEMRVEWVPMAGAEVALLSDGRARATLFGLPMGVRVLFRIAVLDAEGKTVSTSNLLAVETLDAPPRRQIPWFWLIALAAAGAGVWLWRKKRGREDEETERRLRNLEHFR